MRGIAWGAGGDLGAAGVRWHGGKGGEGDRALGGGGREEGGEERDGELNTKVEPVTGRGGEGDRDGESSTKLEPAARGGVEQGLGVVEEYSDEAEE